MRMLVLLFEFGDLASEALPSALAENMPLPVISFILYPEHDFLRVANIRLLDKNIREIELSMMTKRQHILVYIMISITRKQ